MLYSACFISSLLVTASRAATTTSGLVCTSSQCLIGSTNSLLAATLSSPALSAPILLLPDTYSSSSPNLPSVLLAALQSPLTTISLPSPTFLNSTSASGSTLSLPLTVAQNSPVLTFPNANFSGPGGSFSFPEANTSFTPQNIAVNSVMVADGLWAAFTTNSSSVQLIVWDSIADFTQLSTSSPFSKGSGATLVALQSTSCSTPCSSAGTCTSQGTCSCPSNFSGTSCETCAPGFFGPTCQKCPSDCQKCDDGPSGTGVCLSGITANPPSSCNCLNGICADSGGSCTCNSGWTTNASANTTQCSVCADGFFNSGDGNCQVCGLGCNACAQTSGACTSCASGLTQDPNNPQNCVVATSSTTCADGTFSDNGNCTACSTLCKTCKGPLSTDCIICGAGRSMLDGQCVSVDSNGVCQPATSSQANTTLLVNNAKNECDTCPSACTACQIPGFSIVSTIGQAQCTKCLPGYVLSGGRCTEECPAGSFVDPSGDGFTCIACDASCGSCAGSKTHCLTCSQSGSIASNGTCVTSCPSSTFVSSGACLPCHGDCQSCSGTGFDKCTACPSSRPVLSSNGRCLIACGQNQFYDTSSGGTGACSNCDSSCSTCTGAGPSNCMSCPSGKVLQAGTCVDARCKGGDNVGSITSLGGICLAAFVSTPPPVSSVTITTPTSIVTVVSPAKPASSSGVRLTIWEIVLVAVGAIALLVLGLVLWRRQARISRANETQAFREAKLEKSSGILAWFGFGGNSSRRRRAGTSNGGRSRQNANDGWRYEMETVEQGMARRRSSVLHSPIADRFATGFDSDVRARKTQHRTASIYSASTTTSAFTSPSSPRERDEYGNALGYKPRGPTSNAGTAWTAPSVYSQPSNVGPSSRYKRLSPPPSIPEYNPSVADADGYLGIPQPRQPIRNTSTVRYAGDGPTADVIGGGTYLDATSSGTTALDQRYHGLSQTQPLVDVPLLDSDDLSGENTAKPRWMLAMNQMPSNSPQRNNNPFRTY